MLVAILFKTLIILGPMQFDQHGRQRLSKDAFPIWTPRSLVRVVVGGMGGDYKASRNAFLLKHMPDCQGNNPSIFIRGPAILTVLVFPVLCNLVDTAFGLVRDT